MSGRSAGCLANKVTRRLLRGMPHATKEIAALIEQPDHRAYESECGEERCWDSHGRPPRAGHAGRACQ
jgi:hypothetical protein